MATDNTPYRAMNSRMIRKIARRELRPLRNPALLDEAA